MQNYIDLAKRIMAEGHRVPTRTGIDAISIFGTQLRWDLAEGFPLLTCRKLFFRGIKEELLFFLKGETDTRKLAAKKVHIWDANTTREFLDARGLHNYPEGEMGPGYGWQWRNWGGEYEAWKDVLGQRWVGKDYDGIDQIGKVVTTLQSNPFDRRMIVSAWNVSELNNMALPPCHMLFQVDATDGRVSLQWYQRSVDLPLGLPFNIASYALLCHIIADMAEMPVGDLIFVGGNTHIYANQLDGMRELVERTPKTLPQITVDTSQMKDDPYWRAQDPEIRLEGYDAHPSLKMPFAT